MTSILCVAQEITWQGAQGKGKEHLLITYQESQELSWFKGRLLTLQMGNRSLEETKAGDKEAELCPFQLHIPSTKPSTPCTRGDSVCLWNQTWGPGWVRFLDLQRATAAFSVVRCSFWEEFKAPAWSMAERKGPSRSSFPSVSVFRFNHHQSALHLHWHWTLTFLLSPFKKKLN